MNPLISLVIPVYNVEKYLDKCMESVLAQTYDNFEVILVDDGSTDSSGKMCDGYAERDSRVTVYHKQNGGLSDARNFGVEHCNGDLVSFIDSDDYVTEDYLEYLWYLMICLRMQPLVIPKQLKEYVIHHAELGGAFIKSSY